jgi:uncharacterized protein with PIN domain
VNVEEPYLAYFRLYAELNDHLSPDRQYKTLEKSLFIPSTVKDMIESFGVPHTEVDLVIANDRSVDFGYIVQPNDRIAVYPMFESLDVTPELRVRPQPLREPKFVLDVHLGKLAAYLRMLGFDASYRNSFTDAELVAISAGERRILLTRDRGLLKHNAVTHGYWLRETASRLQIAEIVRRFDLAGAIRPFTRCMACNGILSPVSTEEVRCLVPARIAEVYDEFLRCEECGRAYWKGSHYDRMRQWVETLRASPLG